MGAWSNKPFGNDTALDWFDMLKDCEDGPDKIDATLRAAIESCEHDASAAEEGVAAAAIVAAASWQKVTGIFKDAVQWIERFAYSPSPQSKALAISALNAIENTSELKELWLEVGKSAGWENELKKIKAKLMAELDQPSPVRHKKKITLPRTIGKLVELFLKSPDSKIKDAILRIFNRIDNPNLQESITGYDLPLNLAAKAGIPEAVSILIDNGAKVNAVSRFGRTPLTTACLYGRVEAARILLRHGAELFINIPMYDENAEVISERKVCVPLLSSARQEHPELLVLLKEYGANITETDLNGETILHKASESGNLKIMDYLISSGLDVNQNKGPINNNPRSRGEVALHYAVRNRQLEAIKLLIQHGADVNALEYFIGEEHTWFHTPLDLISESQHREIYRYLCSHGAVNASDLDQPGRLIVSDIDKV
ncbi:MAG: ankyrin repeat domain-containing protein [Candidatus Thiodiazotropha sp.]